MATNRTERHFGRYNVSPRVKTTAALLGLSAILYVAVSSAEHELPIS